MWQEARRRPGGIWKGSCCAWQTPLSRGNRRLSSSQLMSFSAKCPEQFSKDIYPWWMKKKVTSPRTRWSPSVPGRNFLSESGIQISVAQLTEDLWPGSLLSSVPGLRFLRQRPSSCPWLQKGSICIIHLHFTRAFEVDTILFQLKNSLLWNIE